MAGPCSHKKDATIRDLLKKMPGKKADQHEEKQVYNGKFYLPENYIKYKESLDKTCDYHIHISLTKSDDFSF
ncbi:hypothetical protein NDU88_005496 [Pleurodeles waltl]|uniref:Uncharacterized protein n=1 Tax=Pleurodeles waltl TaxID=8319 RepID=A0AAV7M9H9_PLEWA|nr:hypothetical protein NDU88_005496 [Pleurodeles waltl]